MALPGAMALAWTLILFTCITGALSGVSNDFPPEHARDIIWESLERVYGPGPNRPKPVQDAGSPLFLTPYIKQHKLKQARKAARVDSKYLLPGIESYAGYLTVNKTYGSNLWFWYFPVSGKKVEDTPWIIWLQGGPGCSSLFGLFNELGPFRVNQNETLEAMKYSWGKNHSLLFIDNPVGTGFSFTTDERGYDTRQITIGQNLYITLQQFLTIFPELRKAPMTIAGESYGGKHVPSLGIQILRNKQRDEPINLQSLAIGNGWIDPVSMQRYSYFVREVGLMDDRTADTLRELELNVVKAINDGNMTEADSNYGEILESISTAGSLQNLYNYLQDYTELMDPVWDDFVQHPKIRRSLHVGNNTFTVLSGKVYMNLLEDTMRSSKKWMEELLDNYRVLLYNGHLDVIVAYHPSVNTYNALSFSGTAQFKNATRKPWYHDKELAGYYRIAANLTEVMVRGAGHLVPIDKPAAALGLITAFIRGIPFTEDTAYLLGEDNIA